MKFHSLVDAQKFLIEIGKVSEALAIAENYQPTNEEVQSFVSSRSPLVRKIKNHRKSSAQKANWRKNRFEMMRGIKSFHKSTDGKRMHRKLGRFLSTRYTKDKKRTVDNVQEKFEALSTIASLKQHLLIELQYFRNLYEQVEIEEMVIDNAVPMLTEIERKILKDEDLNEDEELLLHDMVDKDVLLDEFSKITGESFENMKKWCEDIEKDLVKQGLTIDDHEYAVEYMKCLTHSARETKNGVV